jgi:hypothetical protein
MKKQTPFVKSNFVRNAGDHYPTIDSRAVDAFLYHFLHTSKIVDVCADQGSAIVDYLRSISREAYGLPNAMCDDSEFPRGMDAIVTNTPYTRPLVDDIIWRQIERVANYHVPTAAFLLRSTFDHAAMRESMFKCPFYYGQIKICSRLWWTESREVSPIHNYSWFVFRRANPAQSPRTPVMLYYYPPHDFRYATDNLHFKCRVCGSGGKDGGRIKRTSLQHVEACMNCGDFGYSLLDAE